MIIFKKTPTPAERDPVVTTPVADRPTAAEETASVRRRKSDSDGTLRRKRQTAEDNRLL